ncbi:MAG: U32 family peptidase [Clostridia bacterium]|nr:U32 family peptidase [Clostridia bacterium]
MKKKVEILAPAGSFESVVAAVRCKADAVYMGAKAFNARIKADNFEGDLLGEAVRLCHSHGMKVHVTMNTLISDGEISAALAVLKDVCASGADAVILQDVGFASLVKKACPDLERHASTQMSVQTVAGVKLLEEMGFDRVVLPREMNKAEVKKITDSTDVEIEMFVHGAHCMSVSGQCYMSSMFGGRSGNRGLCAQPCRLPFAAEGGTGFDLSLKDLSLAQRIGEIRELGVDSLKIEGRMKRPEYVAAAVTAIRQSRDGEPNDDMLKKLRGVFSRSGFTDGYFENNRGRDMFGTRQKEDVTSATNGLLKDLAKLYEKEQPRFGVDFHLTVLECERVSLSASCEGRLVFIESESIPEKALNKPLTKEGLSERIAKCGGTQFYANKIEIDLDEGLIVPASVINELRRRVLEELENKLASVKVYSFTDVDVPSTLKELQNKAVGNKNKVKFNVRVASVSRIPENLENVENLYIPLMTAENSVEKLKNLPVSVGIEVPRGIFGAEELVEKRLAMFKTHGLKIAYCSTLDAVAIAKKLGFEIHTGFALNVFNSFSAGFFEELGVKGITLSPELTLGQIEKIGTGAKKSIIAYGRLPLMLTRNCPVKNGRDCEECKGGGYLTDRMNKKFPVVCSFGCSEVLNSQPIYMADRLDEIKGVDYLTLYFTTEKKEIADAILDAYRKGKAVKGDYTRGLYYRGAE